MRRVIDTSAILAILLEEPGQDVAAVLLPEGILSAVNLAEVMAKCVEKAVPTAVARAYIRDASIDTAAFTAEHADISGELFATTRKGLLSLGDRACIATAIQTQATIVTADRAWATLGLPCPVELIR